MVFVGMSVNVSVVQVEKQKWDKFYRLGEHLTLVKTSHSNKIIKNRHKFVGTPWKTKDHLTATVKANQIVNFMSLRKKKVL